MMAFIPFFGSIVKKQSGLPVTAQPFFSTKVADMIHYLKYMFCFLVFIFIAGCNNEPDYKVIDFNKPAVQKASQEEVDKPKTLKVAVGAMISPIETLSSYQSLLDYIGRKLNLKVELIQRKTYAEINELIPTKEVDIAFICSGPYVIGKEKYGFEAMVTPVVHGEPLYQGYLIVHKDSPCQNLEDLKGRTFAFTDPDSNTGALLPRYWLTQIGENPDSFFSKTIFTHSHDKSIMSVAQSIVDGACVNSIVWEYFNARNPIFTSQTKIIKKSEKFGSPPLVASSFLPQELKLKIRKLLCEMHEDPEGRPILDDLMIDSFVPTDESWYEKVKEMSSSQLASHPVK
jgi:phosphonate transport system substrate-binding protein